MRIAIAIAKVKLKPENISAEANQLKKAKVKLEKEIYADEARVTLLKTRLSEKQAELQSAIERSRIEKHNPIGKFKNYEQPSFNRATANRLQNDLFEAQSNYNHLTFNLQRQINQVQAIISQKKDTLQKQNMRIEAILDSVDNAKETDIIKLQQRLDKAITTLRQAKKDLEHTYIEAPTDGTITKIYAYPGETVGKDGIVKFAKNTK